MVPAPPSVLLLPPSARPRPLSLSGRARSLADRRTKADETAPRAEISIEMATPFTIMIEPPMSFYDAYVGEILELIERDVLVTYVPSFSGGLSYKEALRGNH